ncbi:MAG: PIG-L family deacetylase [Opitutaceae bacterium]|nr:PIG-L family deacetylase [Opitutaceae bacterium]
MNPSHAHRSRSRVAALFPAHARVLRAVLLGCLVALCAGAVPAAGPMRILVVGGHPDDPETCAGGLVALAARAGHEVACVYLTTGEAGIEGKGADEAARIRRAEAENACRILGARPVFFGQIDGATVVDKAWFTRMRELLERERPDLVITHWPIDTHRDHRACASLVYEAWNTGGRRFALYYMEAMSGHQSQNFRPTDHVDIGEVLRQKHEACFAHASQGITPETYETSMDHGHMERFRGIEAGVTHAEAYVRQDQSRAIDLAALARPVRVAD